jgi:hypothetical protein
MFEPIEWSLGFYSLRFGHPRRRGVAEERLALLHRFSALWTLSVVERADSSFDCGAPFSAPQHRQRRLHRDFAVTCFLLAEA